MRVRVYESPSFLHAQIASWDKEAETLSFQLQPGKVAAGLAPGIPVVVVVKAENRIKLPAERRVPGWSDQERRPTFKISTMLGDGDVLARRLPFFHHTSFFS